MYNANFFSLVTDNTQASAFADSNALGRLTMFDVKDQNGYMICAGIIPDISIGYADLTEPETVLIKQSESVVRNLNKFLSSNPGSMLDWIVVHVFKYESAGLVIDMLRRNGFGPYIGKCNVLRWKSGVLVSLDVQVHFDPLVQAKI